MADAWIYADDPGLAGELARGLAALGFSPRRVNVNGSLVPVGDEGPVVRRPALVVVGSAAGEVPPAALVSRLREHEDLCEVPLVAALDPEHLPLAGGLGGAQELLVRP